jgi:phosphatidylethanolamine-binding protein (PEBP) family uncharacterized protein
MQEGVSKGRVFARARVRVHPPAVHPSACLLALAMFAVGLLAGCGAGSSASSSSVPAGSSTTVPTSLWTPTGGSTASGDAVARVSTMEIAKSSYEHWFSVEKALGVTHDPSHQALGFLITSDWVLAEAAARHLAVSEAEVKQRLAKIEHQSFPQAGSLQRFLAKSGETEADLLARVKLELLESRIAANVTAGKSGAQRKALLASFQRAFERHWKSYTTCTAGYVMEDCAEYQGKPEGLATQASSSSSSGHAASGASGSASGSSGSASGSSGSASGSSGSASGASGSASGASGSASGSSGSASGSSGSASGASGSASGPSGSSAAASSSASSSGGVSSSPGSFAITSPAFERNGTIPAEYTCDGADVSPPLQWSNVPAKAAALVLFVIDDTATGPASGIRWIVGDINPTAKGVAAGRTPEGGIVGSDTQGHAGYGGICPARGKTSAMEFVVYALSKRIPLTPGFQPSVAEQEYGSGKLILGSSAVTYAEYHRP